MCERSKNQLQAEVDGQNILEREQEWHQAPYSRRMVFQQFNLFNNKRVENCRWTNESEKKSRGKQRRKSRKEFLERPATSMQKPRLSGGQKQRVSARAARCIAELSNEVLETMKSLAHTGLALTFYEIG